MLDLEKVIEIDGRTYKLVDSKKDKLRIIDGGTKDPEKGYGWWDDHEYSRRSVAHNFMGYKGMDDLLLMLRGIPKETQNLFATIYLTGSRASEALLLTPEHFTKKDGYLLVTNQPVLKRRKFFPRTYPIRMDEALMPYLEDTIGGTEMGERLIPWGYDWVYKRITGINKMLFPHYLRAYRATQLVVDYNYSVFELMEYYGWAKSETPSDYIRLTAKVLINKMMEGKL